MSLYKQLLPQWGGYLTLAGDLNHARLEQLLSRLGAMEQEVLQARAEVCVMAVVMMRWAFWWSHSKTPPNWCANANVCKQDASMCIFPIVIRKAGDL